MSKTKKHFGNELSQNEKDSLRKKLQDELTEELKKAISENPPEIKLDDIEIMLPENENIEKWSSSDCGTCVTCITCATCVTCATCATCMTCSGV